METRIFKSINEWVKSNPDEQTTNKILDVINREGIKQIRKEWYKKRGDYSKMQNAVKRLKELQMPIPEEILNTVKKTEEEMLKLEKLLPKKKEVKK